MKAKYIYFLIAGATFTAAIYPVAFSFLAPAYAKSPFSCTPFIPCPSPPKAANLCASTCIIVMKDSTFGPQNINVSAGSRIIWVNDDGFAHTSTSYNPSAWSSGIIGPGKIFSLTVNLLPGVYYYHCNIHPQMIGAITVVSSS